MKYNPFPANLNIRDTSLLTTQVDAFFRIEFGMVLQENG